MYKKEQFLGMTTEDIKELEKALALAIKQERKTFTFRGTTFDVRYASYFLEYVNDNCT